MKKGTVRLSKAAILALFLSGSGSIGMQEAAAINLKQDAVSPVANDVPTDPSKGSTMTLNRWKMYTHDETLDMFRKAEY